MYALKDKEWIFVFTGPDGSGRKTVAKLAGDSVGMRRVVSYSTRAPRPGETDGQDYHFVTAAEFDEAEQRGEFLESIRIGRNRYGVKNADVERLFQTSGCIYLIVNPEGADILKSLYGDKVVRLFIYADRATVEARQRELGLSEEVIMEHLSHYEADMSYAEQCEHRIPNYELAHTVFEVAAVLESYLERNLVEDF